MTSNEKDLIAILEQLIGLATVPGYVGDGRSQDRTVADALIVIARTRADATPRAVVP